MDTLSQKDARFSTAVFVGLLVQLCVISVSIAAASLAFGLMLIAMTVWMVSRKQWIVKPTPLDYYLLAYCIVELVSAALAVYPAAAFHNAKRLLLISIVYATAVGFDTRKKINNGLFIFVFAVAGLSAAEIGIYFADHKDRLNIFQSYMTAGGLKMMLSLVIIPFLISPTTPKRERLLYGFFLLPIVCALMLTNTRSSWLGFIAGGIVIAVLQSKKFLLVLAAMIVAFFLFAPAHQVDRARSIVDLSHPSNYGRLNMWKTGLRIAHDHPLLGVGDTDLHVFYEQYKDASDVETGGHLHNNFVTLLVTIGGIGLAVVCALFVRIALVLYRLYRQHRADWLYGSILSGVLAAFCGFQVNGMFEWNWGDHEVMVFLWFFIGLALAADAVSRREALA
ncbi:MAG TPA: O-antigen ligase family protein [Bacteroidota bacterium]|nr:O-antigen ligase family protein [Bacteroidota bacterium]